ncbi:MAG: SGNH/GDSL hydrolase family protein [Candidatus Obscuribacterales bacterium]|nr:SGNH/GDSL hydrolase family protein [Candidatus Obscuribacterales bacterium]
MNIAVTRKPETKGTAPKAKKNIFAGLFGFIVWQAIAILFVEMILFMAGLGEEEMFKLDPDLGSKHMVNKRITWRSEGYAVSYLDADGMREPGLTIAKPANTYRIALLGDSMVEGFQVPIEKTFGQLLNKELTTSDKKVQVLNFGTSGYSTAQEYVQLKKQVMKYKPDLVLLGYNSRDIFENWSAPDQVITNLRPVALHLPGGKLIIDTSPVTLWMNSKRAKFLMQIDWIRQNSRIWGYFSALQTEMSYHNPLYKAFTNFIDKPGKNWQPLLSEIANSVIPTKDAKPSFTIAKFETVAGDDKKAAPKKEEIKEELISSAPNKVLSKGAETAAKAAPSKAEDGRSTYIELITRTQKSLFNEMRKICEAQGAHFAVVVMPVRSALCPIPGMETSFMFIDYPQEISMVSTMCKEIGVPVCNIQQEAKKLDSESQASLFYSVHFTPKGHEYMAQQLKPFLQEQVK